MFRLVESIRLKDGTFDNLHYHQQRITRSLNALVGNQVAIELERELMQYTFPQSGLYKCRVVYDEQITKVEFVPYTPRVINSLRIIEDNDIDYSFKYENRNQLDRLFEQRGKCDDILIIKKGMITDSSYCNILFYDGTKWITPKEPLLRGVMRESLIESGIISVRTIAAEEIRNFRKAKLINAMIGIEGPEIDVSAIVF
jgi:4-amino-4-deoxychorismate lyase